MKHLTTLVEVSHGHSVARFHLETVQSDFQDAGRRGSGDGTNSNMSRSGSDLSGAFCYMRDPGVSLSIPGHHLQDEGTQNCT